MEATTPASGGSGPLWLGAAARVFFSPTEAFRSVAADPQWLGPALICLLLAAISGWISLPVGLEVGADFTYAALEKAGAPPEVVDETMAELPDPENPEPADVAKQIGGQMLAPVFGIVLGALVVHLMAMLMGGRGRFVSSLSLVAVATLVAAVGMLLRSVLIASTGTIEISFGPGGMMFDYHTLPAILLDLLDVFQIWFLVVLCIGASIVHGVSRGAGFAVALVWWLLAQIPMLAMRLGSAWVLDTL